MNGSRRHVTGILLALCFGASQAVCACPSLPADGHGHSHPDTSHHAPAGDPQPPSDHGHEACGHCELPRLGMNPDATAETGPLPAPAKLAALSLAFATVPSLRDAAPRATPHRRTLPPLETPVSRRDLLLD